MIPLAISASKPTQSKYCSYKFSMRWKTCTQNASPALWKLTALTAICYLEEETKKHDDNSCFVHRNTYVYINFNGSSPLFSNAIKKSYSNGSRFQNEWMHCMCETMKCVLCIDRVLVNAFRRPTKRNWEKQESGKKKKTTSIFSFRQQAFAFNRTHGKYNFLCWCFHSWISNKNLYTLR